MPRSSAARKAAGPRAGSRRAAAAAPSLAAQEPRSFLALTDDEAHDLNDLLSVIPSATCLAQATQGHGLLSKAELAEAKQAAQRGAELARWLLAGSRGPRPAPSPGAPPWEFVSPG